MPATTATKPIASRNSVNTRQHPPFRGAVAIRCDGALLLRQADRKLGLLRRVARCFTDYRRPECIEHRLEEMLAQRIYGLALGYEDWNDHELLRQDPLLGVLAGKRDLGERSSGKVL